jgi:predicted ATPase
MASLYGDDPGVTSHCFAALSLWFLGYPDQALATVRKALDVAKQTGSPYCETFALDFVTWIHVLRREEAAAEASIAALMRIASEQGFRFLLADSKVLRGWALAAQGREAEGLEEAHSAIAAYEATGAMMSRPSHLMLLSKVYGQARRIEEALGALSAARSAMESTGERSYEAEMHRLEGELRLARSDRSDRKRTAAESQAEASFQKAVDAARRQGAKSLELRAATSLGRLWQRQGKRRDARKMLRATFEWFGEGLGTADLKEARALLSELG